MPSLTDFLNNVKVKEREFGPFTLLTERMVNIHDARFGFNVMFTPGEALDITVRFMHRKYDFTIDYDPNKYEELSNIDFYQQQVDLYKYGMHQSIERYY